MMIVLDKVKPGDVIYYWHDTGCFGHKPYYAVVEAVTPKRLRVMGERGERGIKKPDFFDKVCSERDIEDLRRDYPKWPMWSSPAFTSRSRKAPAD